MAIPVRVWYGFALRKEESMMQKNAKMKYFGELTLNLQREGFTIGPEADSLLPVELAANTSALPRSAAGSGTEKRMW